VARTIAFNPETNLLILLLEGTMNPKEDFFKPPIHYTPVRFLFIE